MKITVGEFYKFLTDLDDNWYFDIYPDWCDDGSGVFTEDGTPIDPSQIVTLDNEHNLLEIRNNYTAPEGTKCPRFKEERIVDPRPVDPNGVYSGVAWFRDWRRLQTTKVLAVELPREREKEFRVLVKSLGGKIL